MMNRFAVESIAAGRRVSTGSHQLRRDRISADGDEALDLFSRTRSSTGSGGGPISPAAGSDGHNEAIRLERISVGAARTGRGGMDDLLNAEIGKHDYDWLLTPPETPLFPSSVAKESDKQSPVSSTPRGRTTARSVSNTRPSRLSTSQTENGHSTRPVRSSSVTRPSVSNNYSSSSFSNNNRTAMLNTSSASVTSSRPSTPGSRSTSGRTSTISTTARSSTTSTTARPSITSTIVRSSTASRPIASRLPTPTRTRPIPTISGDRVTRPSNNSRPSTPTSSRPQTPSNPKPNLNPRPSSRPSTPTRRPTTPAAPSGGGRYPSVGRIPAANSRNQAAPPSRPSSPGPRPSSPGPRPRAPVRPIDLPDFPNDVPPNLRTKLPERPASAGRTRPGMALTLRANPNSEAVAPPAAAAPASSTRRNYLPVVSRSRFPENPPKTANKLHSSNGHEAAHEIQKPAASDGGVRRPTKPTSATESTGFGRTISKKSLDMALRHMDIRQGMGGIRASSLFPQSIRSTTPKGRPARKSDPVVPLASDELAVENGSCNGTFSPAYSAAASENGDFAVAKSPDRDSTATRESEVDIQGSSRYDAFMLKEEDSENMSWLHSVEDKSNQSPVFDHRFEPLPEPFGLL
ncbi:mucin-5AC-like [Iris pallida]|uniref:Mucin-5AC-like n=1 Tax=Iris pallida TaxID=29817 RepID=A0AAX6HUS7_IRIPA|nr:mucin-5AC-like [Iris pallida]